MRDMTLLQDEQGFFQLLRDAANKIRLVGEVCLVFHNDADGLCSAATALATLNPLGVRRRLVCIEKVHPSVVAMIHSVEAPCYLYLDIGSGRADLISEAAGSSLTVIVDHHDPMRVVSGNVMSVNAEFFGYSGETDVSGSTTTYLLSKQLGLGTDGAWMAVVGSAEIPGPLRSLNRLPLIDAVEVGDVQTRVRDSEESYRVKPFRQIWSRLSSTFTLVGSVGYYRGGPEAVLDFCARRSLDKALVEELASVRRRAFAEADASLRIRSTGGVQWFHVGRLFEGMGSKVIGTFTSILSYRPIVNPNAYLVGFMDYQNTIPGLGSIPGEWVKASLRAPRGLAASIKSGLKTPVSQLAARAASRLGGTADGHSFAASALLPAGTEEEFIELMSRVA